MPKAKYRKITRHRSSITGRFVKPWVAKKYPDTTETEQLKVPIKPKDD